MPIRAASEATNRVAAHVNVGVDAARKSGGATSVWRMMNTFKQFSWLGEMDKKIRAVVLLGGRLSGRFVRRCL
jgi:hypothetical protein